MIQNREFITSKPIFDKEKIEPGDMIIVYKLDPSDGGTPVVKDKGMIESVTDTCITYQVYDKGEEGLKQRFLYVGDLILSEDFSEEDLEPGEDYYIFESKKI
ncbi:hypothetical protein [Bacillus phage SPO1L4]|nr:hypothetical protein Goe9_c00420 [Bacillus phage vB_BsuM-Goe9]WIT26375.1 hypothetical protein [Bacillus phage SPO1L3]WIT26574.1 hypothetical protein [Bacillus phage SPO1L4]WIT26773.1 hypothetical protein [Bacillus phage SPO1L5]